MPRRKSLNDLDRQRNRLRRMATDRGQFARARRVEGIYSRYFSNVQRTRSYRNSSRQIGQDFQRSFNATDPNMSRAYEDNALREFDRAFNRQYSQRTYMGLNNG